MATARLFPTELISDKGRDWYARLRPEVEPAHQGAYIAIEVETGDFAVAGSSGDAMRELYRRHPGASFYIRRVGDIAEPELASRLFAGGIATAPERK
jgi:hypothetical protein